MASFYISELPMMESSVVPMEKNGSTTYGENAKRHDALTLPLHTVDLRVRCRRHDGKVRLCMTKLGGLNTIDYNTRFSLMDVSADRE